jgi:hypothetical protein
LAAILVIGFTELEMYRDIDVDYGPCAGSTEMLTRLSPAMRLCASDVGPRKAVSLRGSLSI